MDPVEIFCRQVRARSDEHRQAIDNLLNFPGQIVPILRQELDSLIRVIFLLAQRDRKYRHALIQATVRGDLWTKKNSNRRITDREMLKLSTKLHGWAKYVYLFGCSFVHLSNLHDYRVRDPLGEISDEERDAILGYLSYYHGGPQASVPTFDDIIPLLPKVFRKIADNLAHYLEIIENDGNLDDDGLLRE